MTEIPAAADFRVYAKLLGVGKLHALAYMYSFAKHENMLESTKHGGLVLTSKMRPLFDELNRLRKAFLLPPEEWTLDKPESNPTDQYVNECLIDSILKVLKEPSHVV